jgi:uncharacterized PurR-regulated membrane protein YhhQ (DUF165 family)
MFMICSSINFLAAFPFGLVVQCWGPRTAASLGVISVLVGCVIFSQTTAFLLGTPKTYAYYDAQMIESPFGVTWRLALMSGAVYVERSHSWA